ncbi:exo-alpha-sialidase [Ruficoccus amylovorans]|uniref:Exo-alpha-sialidase n=1 Tax=Ruficoccus amylovorans TaxID=1804625 RepID=A0A842HH91_9BACT|nr:sialidase family protein [Ruficoccus amylovorans]MBC2595782.1 exo-alpha-sialidase [Ruficoccus amylovorans]
MVTPFPLWRDVCRFTRRLLPTFSLSWILNTRLLVLAVGLAGAGLPVALCGQDFERVPGTVIGYIEAPRRVFNEPMFPVYVCDPCIVVLPNGDYVATHACFDWGSSAKTSGTTWVYRSSDKGETWTLLTRLEGILRASLFVHDGDLYLLGPEAEGKAANIRKSTDNGETWTEPIDEFTGKLGLGRVGTPGTPVVHGGRIWIGAGRGFISAPVDADLMRADSWTGSNMADGNKGQPFGDRWLNKWGEGQVVAAPRTQVYVLPMIRNLQNTALIRAQNPKRVDFDASAPDAFPSLPGADKKFGVGYDEVSDKFYALTNPVLKIHEGVTTAALTRTGAAVVSSHDLIHWDVEKLFLYTPNIDSAEFGEGFQYFNFDFDGDDMVVASRTAFDVGDGERKPPRGHDSNLMTFHRIANFRQLKPEFVLVLDPATGRVNRYEKTQYMDAPLGAYALGEDFAEEPLGKVVAMGAADDGSVYLCEDGGRTLRFDRMGNFLAVVDSAPVKLGTGPLEVEPPEPGQRAWTRAGSGDWAELDNWFYWGRPDTLEETVWLGSASGEQCSVKMDTLFAVGGINFRNPHAYVIEGAGALSIGGERGGELRVVEGAHRINVPVTLAADTVCAVAAGCDLTLAGPLDLAGHTLTVDGEGTLTVAGEIIPAGGRLVVRGSSLLSFASGATLKPGCELVFEPSNVTEWAAGETSRLWQAAGPLAGKFKEITLPRLPKGLSWDRSKLYPSGEIRVVHSGEARSEDADVAR